MDKIKKAFRFGDPSNADYELEMKRREQEHIKRQYVENERYRQMMNSAQNSALQNPYQQQEKYAQGWADPRLGVMTGAVPITSEEALVNSLADTNRLIKQVVARMEKQERRIEMLSGFYTWITEVYPEIAAQHKAMRDLYEAANAPQQETQGKQA